MRAFGTTSVIFLLLSGLLSSSTFGNDDDDDGFGHVANLVDELMSQEADEDERFLQEESGGGVFGSRCNRRRPCGVGLDCVGAGFLSICFPYRCLIQGSREINNDSEFKLDKLADQILADAGLTADNFWNLTTMRLGKRALSEFGARHIVNDGVQEALQEALARQTPDQEASIDFCPFQDRFARCLSRQSDGNYTFTGIMVQGGLGGTFQYTVINEFRAIFRRTRIVGLNTICLGAGADLGFRAAFIIGTVNFLDEFVDLRGPSLKADLDVPAIGTGAGIGVNWHIPEWRTAIEISFPTLGYGGGVGVAGCFGFGGANITDSPTFTPGTRAPSSVPTFIPITRAPTSVPTSSPSCAPSDLFCIENAKSPSLRSDP